MGHSSTIMSKTACSRVPRPLRDPLGDISFVDGMRVLSALRELDTSWSGEEPDLDVEVGEYRALGHRPNRGHVQLPDGTWLAGRRVVIVRESFTSTRPFPRNQAPGVAFVPTSDLDGHCRFSRAPGTCIRRSLTIRAGRHTTGARSRSCGRRVPACRAPAEMWISNQRTLGCP